MNCLKDRELLRQVERLVSGNPERLRAVRHVMNHQRPAPKIKRPIGYTDPRDKLNGYNPQICYKSRRVRAREFARVNKLDEEEFLHMLVKGMTLKEILKKIDFNPGYNK